MNQKNSWVAYRMKEKKTFHHSGANRNASHADSNALQQELSGKQLSGNECEHHKNVLNSVTNYTANLKCATAAELYGKVV